MLTLPNISWIFTIYMNMTILKIGFYIINKIQKKITMKGYDCESWANKIPKEFDQRKGACIIYQRNEICVFVEIGKQFCFWPKFASPINAIMQLKGDKHEIENTQQEFPRPCVIYRLKICRSKKRLNNF